LAVFWLAVFWLTVFWVAVFWLAIATGRSETDISGGRPARVVIGAAVEGLAGKAVATGSAAELACTCALARLPATIHTMLSTAKPSATAPPTVAVLRGWEEMKDSALGRKEDATGRDVVGTLRSGEGPLPGPKFSVRSGTPSPSTNFGAVVIGEPCTS
jgi:hypothetical protein